MCDAGNAGGGDWETASFAADGCAPRGRLGVCIGGAPLPGVFAGEMGLALLLPASAVGEAS